MGYREEEETQKMADSQKVADGGLDGLTEALCRGVEADVLRLVGGSLRPQDSNYATRRERLLAKRPTDENSQTNAAVTLDGSSDGSLLANVNPLYSPNLLQLLNSPFDNLDQILLRDLTSILNPDSVQRYSDGDGMNLEQDPEAPNHLANLVRFSRVDGDRAMGLEICGQSVGSGHGLLVDSFSYAPFVDYSVDDPSVGVYQNEDLTRYNSGVCDSTEYVDRHHGRLTENLFQLGNLEKDLEEAKLGFRQAVRDTDSRDHIHVLCSHLMGLFARLTNIRLCHEVYGTREAHSRWEGILALDIWYQLLYRAVDQRYPFDPSLSGVSPMAKLEIKGTQDGLARYVQWDGKNFLVDGYGAASGLEFVTDPRYSVAQDPTSSGHALLWDHQAWERLAGIASETEGLRNDCQTPRGVLASIARIVAEGVDSLQTSIMDRSSGDYSWFDQTGNSYVDDTASQFTRHCNLHLGAAYEAMSPMEYCQLMGVAQGADGTWTRPAFSDPSHGVRDAMLRRGCETLADALAVVGLEQDLMVWNSSANRAEVFQEENSASYSQAQCAVAIERVFLRIYQYLHFRSTTKWDVPARVSLDSGYKYLTTETLMRNDNGGQVYFDPSDEVSYLRYLGKLGEFL